MPRGGKRSTSFNSETARAAGKRPRRTKAEMRKARAALAKVDRVPGLPEVPVEELPEAIELAHAFSSPTMAVAIDMSLDDKLEPQHRLAAIRLVQQYAEHFREEGETPEIVELRQMIKELTRRVEGAEKDKASASVTGLPGRPQAA